MYKHTCKLCSTVYRADREELLSTPINFVTKRRNDQKRHLQKLFILRAKSLVHYETTKNRMRMS